MHSDVSQVDVVLGLWKNIGFDLYGVASNEFCGARNLYAMSFQPLDRKTHSMNRRRYNLRVKMTSVEVW